MTTKQRHPDCDCPIAEHRHGSRTTYIIHQCRCDDCRAAVAKAVRDLNRQKLYGRYNKYVDGDIVRAHMHTLMAQGMGWKRIARAAGVHPSTVSNILYGKYVDQPDHPEHRPPRKRVFRRVAEAILTVDLDLAGGARIDPTGSMRRIQALVVNGWPLVELARRLGMDPSNMDLHKGTTKITAARHAAVVALFEQLWDQAPDARTSVERAAVTRARNYARRLGWAPALAWDDDSIDDPLAAPNIPRDARPGQKVTREDLEHMIPWANTTEELARMLGVTMNSIHTILARHGIELPRRFRVVADELREARQSAAARRPRGVAAA